jgi:hypothetical protein
MRYMLQRAYMLPDIGRWIRLLHFFHPRNLVDHWQDANGVPLPKLSFSQGLSVEIYNWCRPIIEVYGSLLAGQKPMPFDIDVPPLDAANPVLRFRSDAQEKILRAELYHQKIPLHFLDFCTSVVLFGIGYVMAWVDPDDRRLRTQAIPWPGDVLPQWGSDRYGRGEDALESVIITERVALDTANRLYPDVQFTTSMPDLSMRPDGTSTSYFQIGTVQILKVWWRWRDEKDKEKIGYAEIAFAGTRDGEPAVIYRNDDTGYPDIPLRWASRFQTPGEPPHRAAGVLDDVVGINTEYNERLSAFSDMLMKLVYVKYKAKGFTVANAPRFTDFSNTIPMGLNQDLLPIQEQVNPMAFEGFLARLETMMLTVSGLSRLIMGSVPPGSENSGEALQNLLHASISRLEVVRTPIQWAWTSLIDEIWVPLLVKWGKYKTFDPALNKSTSTSVKELFVGYNRVEWIWPDVTPRDALKTAELAMNLGRGGWLADETVMKRAGVPSALDEMEKIRVERKDIILHPAAIRDTLQAEQMARGLESQGKQQAQIKVNLTGQMDQQGIMAAEQAAGVGQSGNSQQDAMAKGEAQVTDTNNKAQAAQTPVLSSEDNATAPGSQANAVQGIQQPAPEQAGR